MTVNFENYLDSFKMNRHAKHQGQRSFTSKLLSIHTDRQTDTHTHTHTHAHIGFTWITKVVSRYKCSTEQKKCSIGVQVLFGGFCLQVQLTSGSCQLPHKVNCGRFCLWRRQSVVYFVCVRNIQFDRYNTIRWTTASLIYRTELNKKRVMKKLKTNHWTDLRQIHKEDVFGPALGGVSRSRSKIKAQGHQGQKTAFSALSAACMRFLFGKTSLASSFQFF